MVHRRCRVFRSVWPCACVLVAAVYAPGPMPGRAPARGAVRAESPVPPWIAAPVGQFGGSTWAMAVDRGGRDGIVWLAQGPRVVAIDVRNRAAPMVVGRSGWMDRVVTALAVDGPTGVALTGFPSDQPEEEGLHTLDLSDPSAPRVVARLPLEGAADAVTLAGGIAYVVRETYDPLVEGSRYRQTITAVDVRDPATPRVVHADVVPAPFDVIDVQVAGRALVVTALQPLQPPEFAGGKVLHVFDLADPAVPAPAAKLVDEAWCRLGEGPGADQGGLVYGYGDGGGIVALDVSVPAAPREVRRWPDASVGAWGCHKGTQPLLIVDDHGLPYLATHDAYNLKGGLLAAIGPPDDAAAPRPIHHLAVGPVAAAIVGPHALVADAGGDVTVIDTRALAVGDGAVEVVGTLPLLGGASAIATRQDRDDGRLYASLGYGGISVLSLGGAMARPLDPPVTGRFVDGLSRSALHVAGGWVAAGRTGLAIGHRVPFVDEAEVVDAADPAAPRFHSAFGDGRFARVWTTPAGDWIVHGRSGSTGPATAPVASPVGDPPGRADVPIPLDMRLFDGATAGGRFVAVGAHPRIPATGACAVKRLAVWALSDARAARSEGELDLGPCDMAPKDVVVAAAGELAYVGAVLDAPMPPAVGRSELTIVALSGPAAPRIVARLPLSGIVATLAVRDGYVFASGGRAPDGRPSVIVVDARDPSAPHVVGALAGTGSLAVAGGRVYVSTGQTGVWVFEPPLAWRWPRGEAWLALPWVGMRATR